MKRIVFVAVALLAVSGCRSHHIDTIVENRTGAEIRLLEVDYPSASFGADRIASRADFQYRIQLSGSGQLKIAYTDVNGKQVEIAGPALAEPQQGRLEIVLLPGAKAEFHPQLTPVEAK